MVTSKEILILEDDALIAMDIEDTLGRAGYEKLSIHSGPDAALDRLDHIEPAAALLDFNLGRNRTSAEVADQLLRRNVPFVFLTGYTDATSSLPSRFSEIKKIAKPFRTADLLKALSEMVDPD